MQCTHAKFCITVVVLLHGRMTADSPLLCVNGEAQWCRFCQRAYQMDHLHLPMHVADLGDSHAAAATAALADFGIVYRLCS